MVVDPYRCQHQVFAEVHAINEQCGKGKLAIKVPLGLNYSAGRVWKNLKPTGISYSENPAGSGDAAQRLKEMDQDGVDAEILFPAVSGQRSLDSLGVPREAYVAMAQGYNNW